MAPPLRPVLALAAAAWLAIGVVLGARHEAGEAHAIDARGDAVHASRMAGVHRGHQPDIHALVATTHGTDACAIVSALHQPGSAQISHTAVAAAAALGHVIVELAAASLVAASSVYRLAPKTSPPPRALA